MIETASNRLKCWPCLRLNESLISSSRQLPRHRDRQFVGLKNAAAIADPPTLLRVASLRNEILITIRASVVSVISNVRLVAQLRGNRIVRRVAFSNVHLYTCVYFENVDCQLSAFILFSETEDNAEYFSRNNSDKFTVMKERSTIAKFFVYSTKSQYQFIHEKELINS